jgi:LPS sulfotransferase NodH
MERSLARWQRRAASGVTRARRRARHEWYRRRGHDRYRPFVLLARSRTGSNLLLSQLESHPQVRAEGELFQRLRGRRWESILAGVHGRQPPEVRAAGFKLFYYHPLDALDDALWRSLAQRRDLHVLHLRRRNTLRVLVSRKIAERSDVWSSAGDPSAPASKAVSFTPEELEAGFRETEAWEQGGAERFRDHPVLDLWYEDLVAEPRATFDAVTDFLGVERRAPSTRLVRQNPEPLHELITNFEALERHFRGTRWGAFFSSPDPEAPGPFDPGPRAGGE